MLAEMTPDDKMGWFHNHGLGKIENWLEKPLEYCCRIICCEKPFTVASILKNKEILYTLVHFSMDDIDAIVHVE